MEGINDNMSSSYHTPTHDLIVPETYASIDESPLRSVTWFQEHLNLSNRYVANVIDVREDVFDNWKSYHYPTPTESQLDDLRAFSTTLTHLLSFLNFRQDLMMNILESSSESPQHEPTCLTPPWLGTSLKSYIESQGMRGIEKVDRWVQALRWSDPF
jgi:hypothetical protein